MGYTSFFQERQQRTGKDSSELEKTAANWKDISELEKTAANWKRQQRTRILGFLDYLISL
jgi:hypothetical protein